MKEKSQMKIFLDWIGGIAAFITIVAYALLIINANWAFLPPEVLNILFVIKVWAPLIVVAITALEFSSQKSFILKIIVLALIAVIVLSMFFPDTWNNFVGLISAKE